MHMNIRRRKKQILIFYIFYIIQKILNYIFDITSYHYNLLNILKDFYHFDSNFYINYTQIEKIVALETSQFEFLQATKAFLLSIL